MGSVSWLTSWSKPAATEDSRSSGWQSVKERSVALFEWFGELGLFCWRMARAAVVPPYEFRELIRQMDEIGSKSLPVVALAGAATGVVISLQTRDSLVRFGAQSLL